MTRDELRVILKQMNIENVERCLTDIDYWVYTKSNFNSIRSYDNILDIELRYNTYLKCFSLWVEYSLNDATEQLNVSDYVKVSA